MSNHGGKHAGAGPKSANYYATGYKPAGTSDVRVAPDPELEAAQVKMERLLQEARGQSEKLSEAARRAAPWCARQKLPLYFASCYRGCVPNVGDELNIDLGAAMLGVQARCAQTSRPITGRLHRACSHPAAIFAYCYQSPPTCALTFVQ